MSDLLVNLLEIPQPREAELRLLEEGVRVQRALAPDRSEIAAFAETCSDEDYSDEVRAAFANQPATCYIAVKERKLVGFACFEATARDFFGPMAVTNALRKRGVGGGAAAQVSCIHERDGLCLCGHRLARPVGRPLL